MKCRESDCAEVIKDYKWAKIRAHTEGWFFPKEGGAYCPKHVPKWVKHWRETQPKRT